jgi:hypothetical protein
LNLIGSSDIPKLLKIVVRAKSHARSAAEKEIRKYQKLHASCSEKLKKYWHAQSYSTIAAEKIRQYLGMGFIIHNKTRWNSSYDAVARISQLAEEKKEGFAALCRDLSIAPFTKDELMFMREYTKVISLEFK